MPHRIRRLLCAGCVVVILSGSGRAGFGEAGKGVSSRTAADYVHAVIEANRTIYAGYIVDRLEKTTSLRATERWEEEDALLLPAQFLKKSSEISARAPTGMQYRLLSLWPINPENGPRSEEERAALESVSANPAQPFTRVTRISGKSYFRAVYPDVANNDTCVSCHNHHPKSPRTDFKKGEVMGAILIDLPLPAASGDRESAEPLFPPDVIADYIRNILQADRTLYAKQIVERLQTRGKIRASQYWWAENGLPLPAQYLLSVARRVDQQNLGMGFRLISLWPINPQNGPADEFEVKGLDALSTHPQAPYTERTDSAGVAYFRAVYPDVAVTSSCVECHNGHAESPRTDFKLNDVMGGISITLQIR
ncbi:MAG: hypothetical protein COV67_12230 [Nitrospinae bacterium CG11_big_fil_rev_8_21_14_0_20_56_8]|nr:MAG: hypothetical protein COV67_12230 [Nitrospinae bacterium CG11_big_fil_rev_8_21_14_0_20_56_8]